MRKSNARERLLQTAGELFHKRGYSEVGINEIISKAETAKASFYQHFPSKEALCEAWLESVHDRSEDHRATILDKDCPCLEKLATYFDELETFMKSSNFRGCPYSNTKAVVDQGCCGIADQIRSHICRQFFCALSTERFGQTKEAEEVANRLFVLYSGATTEAQNLREMWPVEVARRAALDLLA